MALPKICQVLHGMTVGGAEILADRLARQFSDCYEMTFVCLDEIGDLGENLQRDGFSVDCMHRGSGIDLRCMWRIAKNLRKQQVDLVLAHQYTPFFYAMTARCIGINRPIVFVEHGRFHPDYPRRNRMYFNRRMIRHRDRLIAVGNDVRRALIANEGLPAERVEVIYNGVDLEPYDRVRKTREAMRRELGVALEKFVIVQVARLDYLKDHRTAVRAVELLRSTRPNAMLLLVGEGPEREEIEMEIRTRNMSGHVRLLGARSDVPQLLGAADAMLLTSISEGFPLALIEGMAAGLPIVATDVGGVQEVLKADETGFMARAGNEREIASQLESLMDDSSLRARLGAAGKRRSRELFSEPVMHAQYDRVFSEVLSNPPGLNSDCNRATGQ